MQVRLKQAATLAVLLSTTSLVFASSASAQDADNSSSSIFTLLQRIVFGAGEEKIATDTPQSVTVLNQDDIDEQIPLDAGDLADTVPGLSATGGPTFAGTNFNIRGWGNEAVGSGQEGRVKILVDGATKYYESYRMGGFLSDVDLFKRVEVLRGPASSTLYESGVLGGVVNFTTKDASDFLEEGETTTLRLKTIIDSNQDGVKPSAIIATRPLDNLEFLLAGNMQVFGDFTDGDGNLYEDTGLKGQSFLAKSTLYFDDQQEHSLRASYQRTTTDGYQESNPSGFTFNIDTYRETEDETAIVRYENHDSDNNWMHANVVLSYSKQANLQTDFLDADFSYTYYEFKADNTFETIGDNFENFLTVGVNATHHERRRLDLDGTSTDSHPEGDEDVFGAFVQNEFVYNEKLTLIPGIRFDWHELTPTGTTLYESDTTTLRADQPVAVDDWAISPKLAALYKVTPNVSVFGSYSYTERLPGVDEEYSWSATSTQGFVEKEKAFSIEGGLTFDFMNVATDSDRFSSKITAYHNDIKDMVDRGAVASWEANTDARIYGLEVEANYSSEYIFAQGALTVIRGDNKTSGEPLDTIAPDELTLTAGFKIPDAGVRVGVQSRFVDSQDRVETGTDTSGLRYQAFHTHDAFVSWRPTEGLLADFEVNARLENVFDEYYQEYLQTASPAKGRNFTLSVARNISW